jgi:hypothetical protein
MVGEAAARVSRFLNHDVETYFAGDIGGPGAILPDIWAHISQADIVIADLTGYNPNVVYEFGAAAAWRPIDTVIIVRDKSDGLPLAFDLQPARHLLYDSTSLRWIDEFRGWLTANMLQCLVRVPFRDEPHLSLSLPYEFSFENGLDTQQLWSPGACHRCILDGTLEFGSPFYFPYSWLHPVGIRPSHVRVQADMKFSLRRDPSWIGIALRSQGYLADQEHLVWLSSDGTVLRTGPGAEAQGKDEHRVSRPSQIDTSDGAFVHFDVSMDCRKWSIKVGSVEQEIPLINLPYVFSSGRILLQACQCRAVVRKIRIETVPDCLEDVADCISANES